MKRYIAGIAAVVAATGIAYAAAPSSAPATTGPAFIAFSYDDNGDASIVRSSGVTSVDESTLGAQFYCVSLDWTPVAAATSDASEVFLSGDVSSPSTIQDQWFGEDGFCPGASAAVELVGNPVEYVTFE